MANMNWESLKVFLTIAESGSLSAAAQILGVNHSTIFRRLNAFEEQLGSRVFERFNSGYELTSAGEELLVYARKIADSFDDLERHVVGKDFQPRGIVKITAPDNIAYSYLSRYLTEFNQIYSEIQIELLVSNLQFNMSSRQADIAVRAASSVPEHLVGRQAGVISWSVYAGSNYTGLQLPKSIEELEGHQLIGATGSMANLPAFIWLDKNMSDQICMRCDDLVAMSRFAEAGLGLAILPDDQLRPEIKQLFRFEPAGTSGLWLLTHPDLRNVERIRLVMKYLADTFSQEEVFRAV